jgi:hypothetical protein
MLGTRLRHAGCCLEVADGRILYGDGPPKFGVSMAVLSHVNFTSLLSHSLGGDVRLGR